MGRANINVDIQGRENLSGVAAKASRSIHELRQASESVARPLKDVGTMMRDFATLGGTVIFAQKFIQGITATQKAFEQLHPEAARAAGSLTNWTAAMEAMKAGAGSAIASVLNPIRSFFIDMVDPTFQATQNLKAFRAEYDSLIQKYSTAGQKAQDEMTAALKAQADAQDKLNAALGRSQGLQLLVTGAKGTLESARTMLSSSMSFEGGTTVVASAQAALATTIANADANSAMIAQLREFLSRQAAWLAERNPDGTMKGKSGSGGGTTITDSTVYLITGGISGGGMNVMPTAGAPTGYWVGNVWHEGTPGNTPPREHAGGGTHGSQGYDTGLIGLSYAPAGLPSEANLGTLATPESSSSFMTLFEALSPTLESVVGSFASLQALIDPLNTIFQAFVKTLEPFLTTLLQPLVGIFTILGQTLALILMPVLTALSPVIELISEAFVWLYNNVIVPFGNTIIVIGNVIYDIVAALWNVIATIFGGKKLSYRNVDEGFLQTIDTSTLTASAEANGYGTGGSYGSNTTVQQPPDINVYITVQGNVINTDLAQTVIEAIEDYLGTGARVRFLEAGAGV